MKGVSISFCFILLLLTSSLKTEAQKFPFKVAEIFSPNLITDFNQQKLILIDFWESWSDPCRPATIQLELVQPHVADKVFMVSVTDESHEVVAQYTAKHPIKLMVIRDWESNLVRQFNIKRWPHAVLLTTNGDLIWQGHPADLPLEKINQYAIQYRNAPHKKFTELFSVNAGYTAPKVVSAPVAQTNTPIISHSAGSLRIATTTNTQTKLYQENGTVIYAGSLTALFAKLYRVPKQQIESTKWANTNVELECPQTLWETQPDSIIRFIARQLKINISATSSKQVVSLMNVVDYSKLGNSTQLNFGPGIVEKYQIGPDRLQADNITIAQLCALLSDEKHEIFKYYGEDYKEYDWDIPYKNDDEMQNALLNQFGIHLRQSQIDLTFFMIE